jgi:hypothetical protein
MTYGRDGADVKRLRGLARIRVRDLLVAHHGRRLFFG